MMKTRTLIPSFLAAPLLAGALLLAVQTDARACEGCKSSMSADTAAEDAGKGFAASIYFMLTMPALLVGGIGYMAWKNCSAPGEPEEPVAPSRVGSEATGERELGAFAFRAVRE